MASGAGTAAVTFSSAMSSTSYAVALTVNATTTWASNAACVGTTTRYGCYFFNVTKTTTGFTISLREASDGNQVTASAAVPIEWVVTANN